MNEPDIRSILENEFFPDDSRGKRVAETHISWVLLTAHYAFKIKKPVRFSFLDFSTLAKRKRFCQYELELNSRLAGDIYLTVLPVRRRGKTIALGGSKGKIIDYAVQMKRLRQSREMSRMLDAGKVNAAHMHSLADTLVPFHTAARIINKPFDIRALQALFNDIHSVQAFIGQHISKGGSSVIQNAIRASDTFLHKHRPVFQQRAKDGFIRDCHGDLHSGNIFLYKQPVIFDCIEFNDEFRQIDVLNEIAFLCMDLEEHRHHHLSTIFLKHYLKGFPAIRNGRDEALFRYYKLYRANIRAKVNALKTMNAKTPEIAAKRSALTITYLQLMKKYLEKLSWY